jgi:hypothetical protein
MVFITLSAAVALLQSCDGATPLEPPAGSEGATSAARGNGSELAPPSHFAATRSGPSRIDLAWRDNSANETGFEILRSASGAAGPYVLLTVAGANTVAHADAEADSQKDHCYRIRAARLTGAKATYSAFSSDACVPASPPSLYTVTARPSSSTSIRITTTWTGTSAAPPRRVYRTTDGGASWELIATGSSTQALTDPRPSEQEACYRVVAYSDGGDAAPSDAACTSPPAGPTNLAGSLINATTFQLTWSDNSSVEDGYQVWLSTYAGNCESSGGSVDEILIAELPAGSTVYDAAAETLIPCEYSAWYYVLAAKDGGMSDASEMISAGP